MAEAMTLTRAPIGSLMKQPLEKRKKLPSPSQKRPGNDEAHLKRIRALPCCICGTVPPSDPHHVKSAGGGGAAMKVADRWTIPMCREHHDQVERIGSRNEIAWFQSRGVDPLTLASALYGARHSLDAMRRVLAGHNLNHVR